MKNFWNWEGQDVGLEVSLNEYRLCWCENEHCAEEGELFFIYRSPDVGGLFGCAYNRESEFSAGRLVGKIFKVKTPYW